MLATDSVASAIPYDGFIAFAGSPYGEKALVNFSIADIVTGSEPLSRQTTLLRSSASPCGGRPRSAVNSKAKLGAAANVRPFLASMPSRLIHRYGRRRNAIGSISVM